MNTRTLPITALALLALLPAARVLAQQPAANATAESTVAPSSTAPAAAEAPVAPVSAGTASKTKDAAGRDTLSVDFPDEDVRNILRNVSDLFELNLVMPETLQGKTTIKLRDVTWRQIFQSVLAPVNFTYVEEGNIIKIVSNDSLLQEPVSTDVFMINYARAQDILPTISSLVDAAGGGKIVVDARSNSLVITERPSRMNRIRPIIEQLDRATDQVMIESKFVEVSDSDVKNIGVNWSSLAAYEINAKGINGDVSRTRGQTGTSGYDNRLGTTRLGTNTSTNINSVTTNNGLNTTTTNGLNTTTTNGQTNGSTNSGNVASSNGVITATSATGTTGALTSGATTTGINGSTTTGINSSTTTGTTGTDNLLTNGVNDVLNNLSGLLNSDGTARSLSAVFSASDFTVVLSALQSLNKTKIVSNPTIVTLNNTQAVINVGQERPIPSYTYNAERGVYEVSGFQYKPIGVILKVTPQVNARGYIKLTVEPEVSQSNRDAFFNGAQIPIVESRKANTTVSLRDGFTMGIGGLMQQAASNGQTKVPVLGSLPVLGRLFRSDTKNVESTNLIIFITAKTISAEGATVEQVFNSERVRGLEMRREELPGYRDGSDPFLPSTPPAPKGTQ